MDNHGLSSTEPAAPNRHVVADTELRQGLKSLFAYVEARLIALGCGDERRRDVLRSALIRNLSTKGNRGGRAARSMRS
jgi:hypothetical protein